MFARFALLSGQHRGIRVAPSTLLRWSDPAAWASGSVPTTGQDVTIPAGKQLLLDVDTAVLGSVTNMGTVTIEDGAANSERVVTCKQWINDGGRLLAGTATVPMVRKLRFVFNEAYPGDNARTANTNAGIGFTLPFMRGLMTMGAGELSLYFPYPTQCWTKLNATAVAAATALTMKDSVGGAAVPWVAGDQVLVGPDQFHAEAISNYITGDATRGRSYTHTIASVAGTTVNLTAGLTSKRWGQRQWATGNGFSTDSANATQGTAFALGQTYLPNDAIGTTKLANINAAITAGARWEIDERTPVANMTRRCVIEAPDDASWVNDGFGCNVMTMRGATMNLHGVEIRRAGQRGIFGRYPIHCHYMSYGQLGNEDSDNTYSGGSLGASYAAVTISGCVVHDSWNRGVVLHATNGVPVTDTICARIKGHAFFLEDGVERKNTFTRCLALQVQAPRRNTGEVGWDTAVEGSISHHIQAHEHFAQGGVAGYWITNPDNNVIDCHAADAHVGFWWSHAANFHNQSYPFSLSHKPVNELLGTVTGNTAHSNFRNNARLELAPTERWSGGGVQAIRYQPMGPGNVTGIDNQAYRAQLLNMTLYKGFDSGYLNRASWTDYNGWVNGDNAGSGFSGSSGETTAIKNTLHFGVSLNNDITGQGTTYGSILLYAAGVASYNFSVNFTNNIFLSIPGVSGSTSGAMSLNESDLYIRAAELGMYVSTGNALLNSYAGFRRASENLSGGRLTRTSALYDPDGIWHPTNQTATWWNVFDVPFLTSGKTTQALPGITGQVLANGGSAGYFGALEMAVDVIEDGTTATRANAYDSPTTGEYLQWSDANARMGGESPEIEFSVDRVQSDYTTLIGTWSVLHGRPIRGSLSNMRHFAMVPNGFYKFDTHLRTIKPRTVWMAIENCYRNGDIFTLAVRLSGAPDGVFAWGGNRGSVDRLDTGKATNLASVASLAALTAHAGNAYFWDGTYCWAKINGNPCPGGLYTNVSQQSSDYRRWTLCFGDYI